jgi:hypothetical protein
MECFQSRYRLALLIIPSVVGEMTTNVRSYVKIIRAYSIKVLAKINQYNQFVRTAL